MSEAASRELRNDTAGVLRRVQTGEEVVITVNGKPFAQLVPLSHAATMGNGCVMATANASKTAQVLRRMGHHRDR